MLDLLVCDHAFIIIGMKYLSNSMDGYFDDLFSWMKRETIPASSHNVNVKADKTRGSEEIRISWFEMKYRMSSGFYQRGKIWYKQGCPCARGNKNILCIKCLASLCFYAFYAVIFFDERFYCVF